MLNVLTRKRRRRSISILKSS